MYNWDHYEWAIFLSKLNEEDHNEDNYYKIWYRLNKIHKKEYIRQYRMENKEKTSNWNREYYRKKKHNK